MEKEMEKERRTKTLVVVVLLVVIAGLTVAFAALSTTLNINGTAYLDAAKWGIRFENLSSPTKIGSATTTGTAKIEETKAAEITGINVSLSTPGDKVTYTVDLVNKGTINAKIDNIEKTVLTSEQQRYLTFKVTDKSGYEIKQGDILSAGETRNLTITIEFIKDLTKEDLPKQTSTISLSYKLNFVQTDDKVTSGSQGGNEKTYAVGDEFCLENECFNVIKDNGTTVDALAKQNVNTETSRQDSNANTLRFAEDNYWVASNKLLSKYGSSYPANIFDSNSLLYEPVQNYKTYLKNTLGKTSVGARLITYEELTSLGCSEDVGSCDSAPVWVYSTDYWTASAGDDYNVWNVNADGSFIGDYDYTAHVGLRPVITISKSDI